MSNTHAQPEAVPVTATKRVFSAQDLPFSINAQSEADIRRTGATNLEELLRMDPGLPGGAYLYP